MGAAEADEQAEVEVEVLAVTRRGLFVRDGEPVELEECDLILCSFETLREELDLLLGGKRGSGQKRNDLLLASPLGALGFWRCVPHAKPRHQACGHTSLAAHLSPLSSHRVPLAANGTPHHTPLVPCTTGS